MRDASRLSEGSAFRVSLAGLRSTSELAPRSPACSLAYGLIPWLEPSPRLPPTQSRQALSNPSRQIKAKERDAVQACLDKQPVPLAALAGAAGKARRSRGSGGEAANRSRTPICANVRVFRVVRG